MHSEVTEDLHTTGIRFIYKEIRTYSIDNKLNLHVYTTLELEKSSI